MPDWQQRLEPPNTSRITPEPNSPLAKRGKGDRIVRPDPLRIYLRSLPVPHLPVAPHPQNLRSGHGRPIKDLYGVVSLGYAQVTMNAAAPRIDVGDWITNRERVRSMRMRRHLAVAGLAGVACAYAGSAISTPLGFATLIVAVAVAFSSLARGVDARFGYWWGWLYPEPKQSTPLDRFVDHLIHRLVTAQVDEPSARVRPLDSFDR